jgi:hypothetical protein
LLWKFMPVRLPGRGMFASLGVTNSWASFERPAARLRHCPRVRSKPYELNQSLRETFPSRASDKNPSYSVLASPTAGVQNLQIKTIAPRSNSLCPLRCQMRRLKSGKYHPFHISKSNGKKSLPFDLEVGYIYALSFKGRLLLLFI